MSGTSTPGTQPGGGTPTATVTPAANAPVRQTPSAPGKFATQPVLKTSTDFVSVLAPLVCAGVNITDATKKADLSAQLKVYFDGLGVSCESTLVVMLPDGFRENKPSDFKTSAADMKLLTPVVTMYLLKITFVIQALNNEGLYLQSGITSSCLAFWLERLTHPGKIGAGVTVLGRDLSRTAGQPTKLPSFTVAGLKDDIVDITSYLEKVVQIFGDNGVSDFLDDEDLCRANPNFSKTFCSRVLGSVKNNVIHGHLFDEIKDSTNCAVMWKKLQEKLRSSELSTSVMMNHWKTFFKLECDTVDSFLAYHNQLKKVLIKLKNCNSTAVADDDFLRVFVHRALDIEELKESVKNLVKPVGDPSITFLDQLDAIKQDCISTTGSQGIQTAGTASSLRARRADATAKQGDFAKSKGGSFHLNALPDLPKNMDNALNPYAFGQMRRWYMLVKKHPKTKQDHEDLENFKWKSDPQKKRQKTDDRKTPSAPSSGARDSRRGNTDAAPNATPSPADGSTGPHVHFEHPPLPPAPHGYNGGYGGGGGGWNPGYSNGMYARRTGQQQPYYPPQHGGDSYPPHNGGGGGPGFQRANDNNRQRFSYNRDNSRGQGGNGN